MNEKAARKFTSGRFLLLILNPDLAFHRRVNGASARTCATVNAKIRVNRVRFTFSDGVHGTLSLTRSASDA
jgi:hypothetical protein